MTALLVTVLASAFAGSLHCAAMCGPLAGLAGTADPAAPRWIPHLAYGAGRLAAYLTLGVIAGALGASIDLAGDLVAIGELAMILAGVAMLAWGALSLTRAIRFRSRRAPSTRPLLYAIRRRRPAVRGALVGVLTAALPCGWLYAFVVVAAGTATPLGGAAVMAAFWLGSTPALLGAGLSLRALSRRLGPRLPVITAVLQLALGTVALVERHALVGRAPSVDQGKPSCH
jgi:hypothetical protein